jgi:type I restriction enzyme R subunit
MDGKAMIVCMSRRICVELYDAIIKLRPAWASAKDDDVESEGKKPCVVTIVMTGSAEDGPDSPAQRRVRAARKANSYQFRSAKNATTLARLTMCCSGICASFAKWPSGRWIL